MNDTDILKRKMAEKESNNLIANTIDRILTVQEQQQQQLGQQQKEAGTIIEAVTTLKDSVGQLVERINKPQHVNWVGIGSLIISLIAAAFIYGEARLKPVEARLAPIEQSIKSHDVREANTAQNLGILSATATTHENEIIRLEERVRENEIFFHELGGQITMLKELVRDIDQRGSRKWNSKETQE
jgi:hypothetical protein